MKKGQTNSGSFKKGHHSTTEFKKGLTPHNKGKKRPKEWSQKQSVSMKKRYADGLAVYMKGKKRPKEWSQKQSTSMKKRYADGLVPPNKGKKASEKTKQKQSESAKKLYASGYVNPMTGKKQNYVHPMLGKSHNEETRRKQSIAQKKRFEKEDVWNKGQKASEATKIKIGLAGKGRIPFNKGKKLSEKHSRSLSIARKKLLASGFVHPMKGKKQNPEWTAKSKKTMAKRFKNGYEVWNKNTDNVEYIEKMREKRLHEVFPPKDAESTEKPLQKLLKENNIKFEKHKPILGQPDIFIEPNVCIFADGDYWHGWLYLQGKDYSKQKKFNNAYFENRIRRDVMVTEQLTEEGYAVLRFWEHEIEKDPEKCFQKIIKIIKESKGKSLS